MRLPLRPPRPPHRETDLAVRALATDDGLFESSGFELFATDEEIDELMERVEKTIDRFNKDRARRLAAKSRRKKMSQGSITRRPSFQRVSTSWQSVGAWATPARREP